MNFQKSPSKRKEIFKTFERPCINWNEHDTKEFTTYQFKPQLRTLGRRFGSRLNELKEVLAGLDKRQRMQEVGTEATRVRKKPLQTSLAGANPNSYSTNHSSPGFSSSFFARVARAFEMAF